MNKKIITIIIALAAVCGCQKTEKTIYKVPLSEHAMELERQEKAYNDSLEKSTVHCSALHRFSIISTSTKQS